MKHTSLKKLEEASTDELTERLAALSMESHRINNILSRRRSDGTNHSEEESIGLSRFLSIKTDSTIRGNIEIVERTDRNGNILEIGDRVRILTKGRIKIIHGTVFEFGKLITVKGSGGGIEIRRKSTNLAKY